MLSTTHRFLFLHVPKTGGNSVQDALRDCSDDRFVTLASHQDGVERFELRSDRYDTQKHSTLAGYRAQYGAPLFDSLFRFSCVRNPWDRVLSYYFSPHRGRVAWSPAAFRAFIPTVQPLRHYVALPGDGRPALARAATHVHRWMRFETLQEDFETVCAQVGLTPRPLAHRNGSFSSGSRPWRDYYDAHTRALVESLFGDEAQVFGYRFLAPAARRRTETLAEDTHGA